MLTSINILFMEMTLSLLYATTYKRWDDVPNSDTRFGQIPLTKIFEKDANLLRVYFCIRRKLNSTMEKNCHCENSDNWKRPNIDQIFPPSGHTGTYILLSHVWTTWTVHRFIIKCAPPVGFVFCFKISRFIVNSTFFYWQKRTSLMRKRSENKS